MAKKRESLIVASKPKAYVKSNKILTPSGSLEALSQKVGHLLDAAGERTKANRRSTIKAQDLQLGGNSLSKTLWPEKLNVPVLLAHGYDRSCHAVEVSRSNFSTAARLVFFSHRPIKCVYQRQN